MHAMILAAGRGERMRPLTDTTPKSMLEVNGKPLIQYQVERLVDAGITQIVINHSYLGEQIESFLGDGQHLGADIQYSAEQDAPLDTGGGICQGLPLLGDAPFIVTNADAWTDYPLAQLSDHPAGLAHLVLVDNPPHNPQGDFALDGTHVRQDGDERFTFSGIGVYRAELFAGHNKGEAFPLTPLLQAAVQQGE
ncbi:MAG: nucleotidyltransferase family protein, partial [Gammaproteobacteria bacterium]